MTRITGRFFATLAAAATLGVAVASGRVHAAQAAPAPAPATAANRSPDAADALSNVIETTATTTGAAVVEIFATAYAAAESGSQGAADLVRTQRATGSGVIVDPGGYIVTNAHVVRGAMRVRVEVPTVPAGGSILAARGRLFDGRIVGIDVETDLAVVKVEATGLRALAFGDSDELRAGQLVLALGSPLGFQNSVSLGVVSAVGRQMKPESPMVYVQTDAAITSGSSGGPLVDLHGRIVGINTLIAARGENAEGLGFAAPSNIVRNVYEQIRKSGYVRRGEIGIRPQTITPTLAAGLGLKRDHGVVLADVKPNGPASRAGLRPGDIVTTLDGKPMQNGRQLQVNLYRRAVGETVSIGIVRDEQPQTVQVMLDERPDPLAGLPATADPREHVVPRLGILGVDVTPRLAQILPPLRIVAGVLVASVMPGVFDSRDGGLAAGDVIHVVNREPVAGLADLRAALDKVKPGEPVVLHLERDGELVYVSFIAE